MKNRRLAVILLLVGGFILWNKHQDRERAARHARYQAHQWEWQQQQQGFPGFNGAPSPARPPQARSPRQSTNRRNWQPAPPRELTEDERFRPVRNLHTLRNRGTEDHDVSGLIVQNELIRKDRKLAYFQQDIDDTNDEVLAYALRAVQDNERYFLRRRIVETIGPTNRAVLVNRLRLVAVLLGGEKGRGGIDSTFTPIREEAHRYSPYVIRQVEAYLENLKRRFPSDRPLPEPDAEFKRFVHSLGDSFQSEHGIASIGDRIGNRTSEGLIKEIYAMGVLLQDLKAYYGEREGGASNQHQFEVLFSHPGGFVSETLTHLQRAQASLSGRERLDAFVKLGFELRAYLTEMRSGGQGATGDEELNHLMKLNEITAVLPGLFAAERATMAPAAQAKALVDLLYLEGLYSGKERKHLLRELGYGRAIGAGRERETREFYRFLSYMNGLAFARLDACLGEAARAFARITPEAINYLEVQARKSALQILGQLQLEVYERHREVLAGKRDIHLAGEARGWLRVFRSAAEISTFLQENPKNGEDTIWVLQSGVTMPNEGSFAAIVFEDPIMKASHYDGYARSQSPPLPLLQVPDAVKTYAEWDRQFVVLQASRAPDEKVIIKAADPSQAVAAAPSTKPPLRLETSALETEQFLEIDGTVETEEIRRWQRHVGSKAANYAFLRSVMPRDETKGEAHCYPGFAIPFDDYQTHIEALQADRMIAQLAQVSEWPDQVKGILAQLRKLIVNGGMDEALFQRFRTQMEERLRLQHVHGKGDDVVKLRFRSSSNAEDTQGFSGAGLYESHAAEYIYEGVATSFGQRERIEQVNRQRVGRAMKEVWASVWKDEAYWARERAGLVQGSVRMGILVHPSYRQEESTGVVFYYGEEDIEIAVNDGNENVQNPRIAGLTPEQHRITGEGSEVAISSAFALSRERILSKNDRKQLRGLLEIVVPKFRALYADQGVEGADLEFKVMEFEDASGDERDVVMLKQIRPLAKRAEDGQSR